MADKEIKIRAVLDYSGFDQQIKQMQDRMTQVTKQSGVMQQAQSQYGKGSGMSKLTQNMFGDFNKSSIGDLREKFNLNVRQMQAQSRDMKEKEREVSKLAKLEEKMTEAQKSRVKLVNDEIKAIKEKGRTLIEENNKIGNMARGLGVQDMAGSGFKGTGVAPQGQQGLFGRMSGGISNIMSQMGGGSVLSGVGTLAQRVGGVGLAGAQVAGDYIDYQRTRDRNLAKNIGQSVQASNVGFDSVMQKKGFMNSFENPERQAALAMAMSEREKRKMLDPLRAVTGAAGSAAAYGGIGAAAGSVIPGLGTAVGGIGGALYGAGKSIMGGGAKSGFAQMFDRDAYNASVNAETLGNFRTNLTSLKMSNPEKFAAGNMFSQRRGSLQDLQRQTNLNDGGMFGDALSGNKANYAQFMNRSYKDGRGFSGLAAGEDSAIAGQNDGKQEGFLTRSTRDRSGAFSFTEERIRNNLNNIFQSGGSSDFVTQQMGSTMAAEYQRGGMSNAARQLGGISGTGNMDGAGTEETYKKFISDAMRIGLDNSELAKTTTTANEEVRRAMDAISNVYTRSGGAEGAASIMAQGMMGGAGAEIAGAGSAFNIRNQESGQGSGYRGALKYAFLNSEKGQNMFKGVDNDITNSLASYNLENLDEDDVLIQKAAQQQGISPADMVEKVRQLQSSGENYSSQADKAKGAAQQGYVKFLKESGMKDGGEARSKYRKSKAGIDSIGSAFSAAGMERGDDFLQQTSQTKDSYVFGGMNIPKELRGKNTGLATGSRGALDTGEGSEASDQATVLQVLTRQLPDLVKAAQENREANIATKLHTFNTSQSLNDLMDFMKEGGEDTTGKVLEQLQNTLNSGQNQPSYGNKKSK